MIQFDEHIFSGGLKPPTGKARMEHGACGLKIYFFPHWERRIGFFPQRPGRCSEICFAKSFGVRKLRLLNPVYRGSGFEVETGNSPGMNPGILEYSKHAWDVNLNGNSTTIVMNWFQEVSKMFVFYTFFFKVFISIPICYFSWSSSIGERSSKVFLLKSLDHVLYSTLWANICRQNTIYIFDHCKSHVFFSQIQSGINKTKPAWQVSPSHFSKNPWLLPLSSHVT